MPLGTARVTGPVSAARADDYDGERPEVEVKAAARERPKREAVRITSRYQYSNPPLLRGGCEAAVDDIQVAGTAIGIPIAAAMQ